jgi:hypothetical protein
MFVMHSAPGSFPLLLVQDREGLSRCCLQNVQLTWLPLGSHAMMSGLVMVTWHGLFPIQPSALRLSSLLLASMLNVKWTNEVVDDTDDPLYTPALTHFLSPGRPPFHVSSCYLFHCGLPVCLDRLLVVVLRPAVSIGRFLCPFWVHLGQCSCPFWVLHGWCLHPFEFFFTGLLFILASVQLILLFQNRL